MADKRMISKKIVDTDNFLDMPVTTRLLYYDLLIRADDEGFVASPNRIMRDCKASEDDFQILLSKQYIFRFDSGVVVIKDWKLHNYIRADRLSETEFQDEKKLLGVDKKGHYFYDLTSIENGNVRQMSDKCQADDRQMSAQVRLGKDRLDKDSIDKGSEEGEVNRKRFTPPTLEQVKDYITEKGYTINAESFVNYYTSNGWYVGRNKMKDWKAAIRTWQSKEKKPKRTNSEMEEWDNA